jgi:alpha-beta hydrolase superfamily lysophospholipase
MSSSILDHSIITQRYFFPFETPLERPFWVEVNGAQLGCYMHAPHPGNDLIVFFHGNGESASEYIKYLIPVYDALGYNCFIAEYRGYGTSSGIPGLVCMLDDIPAIIKSINFPHNQIVLLGRSVGSIYALHAAAMFPNVKALIIESGISDVFQRLNLRIHPSELNISETEMQTEIKKFFDHEKKIKKYTGSTLIMHAKHDALVGTWHGKQLYEWANEPKQLKLFKKGGHNNVFSMNEAEYIQTVDNFIKAIG